MQQAQQIHPSGQALAEAFVRAVRILEANGRAEDKMQLGISNQDYPDAKRAAETLLVAMAVRLRGLEEIVAGVKRLSATRGAYDLQVDLAALLKGVPDA